MNITIVVHWEDLSKTEGCIIGILPVKQLSGNSCKGLKGFIEKIIRQVSIFGLIS